VEKLQTQRPSEPTGVVGAAVDAARSAASAVHDLGARAVDATLNSAADAVRPAYERLGRVAEAADERPGSSKEDMAARPDVKQAAHGDSEAEKKHSGAEEARRRE
jgi:hypothetical protein